MQAEKFQATFLNSASKKTWAQIANAKYTFTKIVIATCPTVFLLQKKKN